MENTTMQSAEQVAATKEKYSERRRRQLIALVPAAIAILLLLWSDQHPGESIAGLPGAAVSAVSLVLILGMVGFSLFNWRCPACGGYLGRTWNPSFCSKCGAALR